MGLSAAYHHAASVPPLSGYGPRPQKIAPWGPGAKPYRRGSPWALVMLLGRRQPYTSSGGVAPMGHFGLATTAKLSYQSPSC
ncbi:MAG: hypothetical protein EAY75_12660 [Bacteroidetes bacterium]|nr:MAG: hypothetical protein EAY75_12660 [Bacteroidota bacterium]